MRRLALRGRSLDASGFTLIELMIVIVVLGILAGVVLFKVGSFRDEASVSACRTDARTLATANAAYVVANKVDAPDIDALLNAHLIAEAPRSGVTFQNGVTSDASCGELAFTPPGDGGGGGGGGATATVGMSAATGHSEPAQADGSWKAIIAVTVKDGTGSPVNAASVDGAWDDHVTADDGCTTGVAGTCSFESWHVTEDANDEVRWTVSSVTASDHIAGVNAVSALLCKRPPSGSNHNCHK
jgi:prepilin-type N-terminal cleavage/methylation domain-containing protein